MVKAMKDVAFPDLGCFAHTLQLIVNELLPFTTVCDEESQPAELPFSW